MEKQQLVKMLIGRGAEGSYWDFKQSWHSNNADLLKDIICMANNTTKDMKDGYIIFGIEDHTFNIIGVSGDDNRKNQENIIGFLSSQVWSGEEIPYIKVETTELDEKEIDVLTIYNRTVTPYYLLKDYSKTVGQKSKTILHAGVIYSRNGDRNTSSAECATKQAVEFLWKKRFGLVGSDELKVVKRLQNMDAWYTIDDFNTLYNREFNDIMILRNCNYNLEVKIGEGRAETGTWVMDFPYLFSYIFNWNIGRGEVGRRANWDIFLEGRRLDITLFGVQSTRQSYYHIEPNTYWTDELGLCLNKMTNSIKYYAYIKDSIEFLAFNLFFNMQCYGEKEICHSKALSVIPIFESEEEHKNFMIYLIDNKEEFTKYVDTQNINEMFPEYAKVVATTVVYKLGKSMVQWLDIWRMK